MAGDWLKIEKVTPRKPEILRLSELLGVHPRHAFGLCFDFWSWCDDQMLDGHAPSVTDVTLDASFGHSGFTSALISVGWLRVRNGSLEVPNFDRHLSESAKARALSGKRKKNERAKKVSRSERDTSVTREEKRRVLIPPKSPKGDFSFSNRKEAERYWGQYADSRDQSSDRIACQIAECRSWSDHEFFLAIRRAVADKRTRLTRPKLAAGRHEKKQDDELIRAKIVKLLGLAGKPEAEIEAAIKRWKEGSAKCP